MGGRRWLGCCAIVLCAGVSATESGDLLRTFSEMSLETPVVLHDEWSVSDPLDSDAFKTEYTQYFNQYIEVATTLSVRAIDCANGELPQADAYESMTDLSRLYASVAETVTRSQTQLRLWQDLNDTAARDRLAELIPTLTNAYSRLMFELSGCSGFLYGELVN